jgi:hypothetical protein
MTVDLLTEKATKRQEAPVGNRHMVMQDRGVIHVPVRMKQEVLRFYHTTQNGT